MGGEGGGSGAVEQYGKIPLSLSLSLSHFDSLTSSLLSRLLLFYQPSPTSF